MTAPQKVALAAAAVVFREDGDGDCDDDGRGQVLMVVATVVVMATVIVFGHSRDDDFQHTSDAALDNDPNKSRSLFDDEDDDPLLRRIRRECEKRVKDCEERLKQSQAERRRQAMLLDKANKDLTDARGEADDAQ